MEGTSSIGCCPRCQGGGFLWGEILGLGHFNNWAAGEGWRVRVGAVLLGGGWSLLWAKAGGGRSGLVAGY